MSRFIVMPEVVANVAKTIPSASERNAFITAIFDYMSQGVMPDFEYPLSIVFAAIREELDEISALVKEAER